jgi:proline dehydrogenase
MKTDTSPPAIETRKQLFSHLDEVITFSREKIHKQKKLETDYQSYLRILVSAVTAYGKLLELNELDKMTQRIETLEQMSGAKP